MCVAGGRARPWVWLGAEIGHGCGGRERPCVWLVVEIDHGCGWG